MKQNPSMKFAVFMVLAAILLIQSMAQASAIDISLFNAEYTIEGAAARTIYTIKFISDGPDEFKILIPADSEVNSVSVDDLFVEQEETAKDTKKEVSFPINSSGKAIVDFTTGSYVDPGNKNYFVADIKSNYPIRTVRTKANLPENSFLYESKKEGGSVFPEGNVGTDGKTIYVEWIKKDLPPGSSFPMFVIYRTIRGSSLLIYFATFLAIGVIAYFGFPYFIRRYMSRLQKGSDKAQDTGSKRGIQKQQDVHAQGRPTQDRPVQAEAIKERSIPKERSIQQILLHLTDDEQQIVNILVEREGHIEQGTLVIITGFSKAHLSRLLDELSRRKIIHKEKKGKKNVIWLKSHF